MSTLHNIILNQMVKRSDSLTPRSGRMTHGQKSSSELGEVACKMNWKLIAKLRFVIGNMSVPSMQKNHQNWKR
ncbi:hypothetical protein ACTXT7_017284, partial [Hymenolepis weldensis]